MTLKQTVKTCIDTAREKRLTEYRNNTRHPPIDGHPPIEDTDTPLLGYCHENARALAYELHQRNIHHQPVRGYILIEAVTNTNLNGALNDIPVNEYTDSQTGAVNPSLWKVIGYPTEDEMAAEHYHWWVLIDGSQTEFDTDDVFHAEIASEAREHYGNPVIYDDHPTQYYYWTRKGYRNDDFDFDCS